MNINTSSLSSTSAAAPTSQVRQRGNDGDADDVGGASTDPQMSQMAQEMKKLQDLQKSDPAKFKQLAEQISQALQSQSQQQTATAGELSKAADVFAQAAQTGQMPAVGGKGGHHHHHHGGGGAAAATATDPNAPSASATSSPAVATYQKGAGAAQWQAVQKTITDVMSSAGI
jgi:hypothetical protein